MFHIIGAGQHLPDGRGRTEGVQHDRLGSGIHRRGACRLEHGWVLQCAGPIPFPAACTARCPPGPSALPRLPCHVQYRVRSPGKYHISVGVRAHSPNTGATFAPISGSPFALNFASAWTACSALGAAPSRRLLEGAAPLFAPSVRQLVVFGHTDHVEASLAGEGEGEAGRLSDDVFTLELESMVWRWSRTSAALPSQSGHAVAIAPGGDSALLYCPPAPISSPHLAPSPH